MLSLNHGLIKIVWGKNENKDHVSPSEAETKAELGNLLSFV